MQHVDFSVLSNWQMMLLSVNSDCDIRRWTIMPAVPRRDNELVPSVIASLRDEHYLEAVVIVILSKYLFSRLIDPYGLSWVKRHCPAFWEAPRRYYSISVSFRYDVKIAIFPCRNETKSIDVFILI